MANKIKALYDEAASLHKQAKDLLAEYSGKVCPQAKQTEIDALLNQVEAKTTAAKRLERLFDQESLLANQASKGDDEADGEKGWYPFAAYKASKNPNYAKALRAYHRKGRDGLSSEQQKALSVGDPQSGGYLVQDTYLTMMLVKAGEVSAMRLIANVLPPVPSGTVIVPAEDDLFSDAEWTTELNTGSDDTVKPFGQRRLKPNPMAKRVKVSNTLLRNPGFDVEAFVRDRMAYKFGIPEEDAFINGDGNGKPMGLLTTAGLPVYTTASSNAVYGDDIINWVYSLPAAYAARARILCNRAFIRKIRTLANKNSGTSFTDYIWQPGLSAGAPDTVLDVPYVLSDLFDDGLDANDAWESNAKIAVIGDFANYWIVDALQMTIQRLVELYAETNQVGFIGRKESDGACVMAEAFYALKVKA